MNSICADTFDFQGIMQTTQKVESTPNLMTAYFFGILLYRRFYYIRREIIKFAKEFHQGKDNNYAEYIERFSKILSTIKVINNKLNELPLPMFVQRIALDAENELSNFLEDLYIASDPEIQKLSQELETLLS